MTLLNPPTPGPGDVWGASLLGTLEDLDDRLEGVEGSTVSSVNGETGVVTLTAVDVGADATGAASSAVTTHVSQTDPHPGKYAAASHNHAATAINSGTMATARLGSGTASSSTFLRGDNTWATPAGAVSSVAGRTGAVTLAKADVGLTNVDNTSDANKPVSTATAAAIAAIDTFDLHDVDTTTPTDGVALVYDEDIAKYVPTDLGTRFAGADPSTGVLLPENAADFTLFGFIVNEGSPPPAGLPLGLGVPIIGFSRAAAPSMVPIFLDDNFAQGATNVVLTLPETLAVGDKFCLGIGISEDSVIDHFSVAFSSGAATASAGTLNQPNGTAGVQLIEYVVTTQIPSAATITVTARDVASVALNRVHIFASAFRLPNLAATPFDVQATSGGNSSSNMNVITVGPTGSPTAQDSEVVIAIAAWNGSTTATRDLAGTNGWQLIAPNVESNNGSTSRQFAVFYKVLDTVQSPSFTSLMTASDAATGQWAAALATFKGI